MQEIENESLGFPISLCPTGMVPKKSDNQFVPVSVREIIQTVINCCEIGITSVHLHARDENENPAWEKHYYEKIISGIRTYNDQIVICVTTSGRDIQDIKKRTDALTIVGECKPDMGSLTLSSMNFLNQESINSPQIIQEIAKIMIDLDIKPEIEIFDIGMLNYLNYLQRKNLLLPPFVVNLLFGNVATMQLSPLEFGLAVERLPDNCIFLAAGLGKFQLKANIMGIVSGGGARVGLEDNLYLDDQKNKLATNENLLLRIVEMAKHLDQKPMPPKVFRDKYLT